MENTVKHRCGWCGEDALYQRYHDREWGVPVKDDALLFEFLVLETFQAGLSWITILKKREGFRAAFDGFDAKAISRYNEGKIDFLMQQKSIVRNRLKIKATIANAKAYLKMGELHGSFSHYVWGFVNHRPITNAYAHYREAPSKTARSTAMAKTMKKDGFQFVGSTVAYAFMQAVGMVNDHETRCFRYGEIAAKTSAKK
ncbi:DNA-3-methyladenine glycosylase I [Maribacter sp. 2307ULW6-5]|uniref:DNA-3-methyladenine glycosylase I n=1 Tax=Maribacter sp. 2307ULW6-5 TaxID=3386275 RepID=UPI0039BD4853